MKSKWLTGDIVIAPLLCQASFRGHVFHGWDPVPRWIGKTQTPPPTIRMVIEGVECPQGRPYAHHPPLAGFCILTLSNNRAYLSG